jgi:hypothetical protein
LPAQFSLYKIKQNRGITFFMAKKTRFELVRPTAANPLAPPANLGQAGREQWRAIQDEYGITDTGGLALLEQLCAATDQIAECAAAVARDGLMVRGKFGPREHPLLKHELALRSFVCRGLVKLGLNVEPVKSVGRPAGWSPPTTSF